MGDKKGESLGSFLFHLGTWKGKMRADLFAQKGAWFVLHFLSGWVCALAPPHLCLFWPRSLFGGGGGRELCCACLGVQP